MHAEGVAMESESCRNAPNRNTVCNLARKNIVWG